MGELNEEKLKQMLEGYSKTIQDKIDTTVNKGIEEIKGELEVAQHFSVSTTWFTLGVALFAIAVALLIYGADKGNSNAFNTGLGIMGFSFVLLSGSSIKSHLLTKRRR